MRKQDNNELAEQIKRTYNLFILGLMVPFVIICDVLTSLLFEDLTTP